MKGQKLFKFNIYYFVGMLSFRLIKYNDKINIWFLCLYVYKEAKDHAEMHVLFGLLTNEDYCT